MARTLLTGVVGVSIALMVGSAFSGSALAGRQSLQKDCKLDKYGNGPRSCQCDALHEKLLPQKVLWHLSQMGVCNAIQTGQGSQSSSGRPSEDCKNSSDRGDPE